MSTPITKAIIEAQRARAEHPHALNPEGPTEVAIRSLHEGAFRRTIDYILGSEPVFQKRYQQDAYFKLALDTIVKATIEATFHHDPDQSDSMERVDIEMMLPVLEPPEFEDGQRWIDQWGRAVTIIDASGDPLSVQWDGGIAPSPIRREHLRSGYTLAINNHTGVRPWAP